MAFDRLAWPWTTLLIVLLWVTAHDRTAFVRATNETWYDAGLCSRLATKALKRSEIYAKSGLPRSDLCKTQGLLPRQSQGPPAGHNAWLPLRTASSPL